MRKFKFKAVRGKRKRLSLGGFFGGEAGAPLGIPLFRAWGLSWVGLIAAGKFGYDWWKSKQCGPGMVKDPGGSGLCVPDLNALPLPSHGAERD